MPLNDQFIIDTTKVLELPEHFAIETRLITQPTGAASSQFSTVPLHIPPTTSEDPILILDEMPTNLILKDASTETESPFPKRDRAQQTEDASAFRATVGLQCNLEEDISLWEDDMPEKEEETTDDTRAKFLDFVKQQTKTYRNGKSECLICGEVAATTRGMQLHMALHWGPKVLCFNCGVLTQDYEWHLKQECTAHQQNLKQYKQIKCPHYKCPVIAISMQELCDHINEHCDVKPYHCEGCNRDFHTAGEYRHHLPLRLKCLNKAGRLQFPYQRWPNKRDYAYRARVISVFSQKKKCILVKSYLTQRVKANRLLPSCSICLKRSTNPFKHSRHTKRCKRIYMQRLNKKRGLKLTNGYEKN